jgi:hypothetical protein
MIMMVMMMIRHKTSMIMTVMMMISASKQFCSRYIQFVIGAARARAVRWSGNGGLLGPPTPPSGKAAFQLSPPAGRKLVHRTVSVHLWSLLRQPYMPTVPRMSTTSHTKRFEARFYMAIHPCRPSLSPL